MRYTPAELMVAVDIAALSRRFVTIVQHEKRRRRELVDYVTSPDYGDGDGWRERVGLAQRAPGGGPSAPIATLGVVGFERGEAVLRSYHPFSDPAEIEASTGWAPRTVPDLTPTPEPTTTELRIIRAYDPHGFWTGAL